MPTNTPESIEMANRLKELRKERNLSHIKLSEALREKYNIIVAGGQGKFSATTFRVGHLGAVRLMDLFTVMVGLELALKELGADIPMGKAVQAMEEMVLA